MKILIRSLFTMRMLSPCVALAVAVMLGTSCQPKNEEILTTDVVETPDGNSTAEVKEVEPVEVPVGRVMGVGEEGRFVVIALDQGATVETGDTLKARFAGAQTAVLKVSPERQGNLVTADVMAGTPAKDHQVVK